ncbi:ferritin-like metal-binding protein YciE [Flavobacterium sp. 245]|nr:ferritin-like metal-binding protein YciE [Flavobacterium sp. 245]
MLKYVRINMLFVLSLKSNKIRKLMKVTTKRLKATRPLSTDYSLHKLFMNQLREMIWSKRLFSKTIPKLIHNISSPNLIFIMNDHAAVTRNQIIRLQKALELNDVKGKGKKCVVIQALINKSKSTLEYTEQGPVRDAAIVANVQKIEHYSIAAITTLIEFGKVLRKDAIVDLLSKILIEEKQTDIVLSEAAYNTINFDAAIDENKFLASHYYRRKTH